MNEIRISVQLVVDTNLLSEDMVIYNKKDIREAVESLGAKLQVRVKQIYQNDK